MLKVIFKVEKLVLRLKKILCEIVAKKDSDVLPLSPMLTIHNGEVMIDYETEFFIIQKDPIFLIQIILNSQGHKKLGGELSLNVAEWDENVHHSTVATLIKSPDRYSHIYYTFIYIRKDILAPQKFLILCSEFRDQNLTDIQGKINQLAKKQNKLEDQIKKQKQEIQVLQNHQKVKIETMKCQQKEHDQQIQTYQQNIDKTKFKNDTLKKKNQEIMRMIEMYGKGETKDQLQKKYPKKIQKIEEQKIILKQQTSGDQKQDGSKLPFNKLKKKPSTSETEKRRPCEDRQRSREKKNGMDFHGDN